MAEKKGKSEKKESFEKKDKSRKKDVEAKRAKEMGGLKKEVSKEKGKSERGELKREVKKPEGGDPFEDVKIFDDKQSEDVEPINPFESPKDSPKEIGQAVVEVKDETEGGEKTEVAEVVSASSREIGGAVTPRDAVVSPEAGEDGEMKESVWDVLEQAGVTKRRIVYFFIILVGLIVALYFVFSGFGKDEVVHEVSDEDEEISASYIFGTSAMGELLGVDAAFVFGGVKGFYESKLVYYNDILRRMENIYNTDVYALLDMSVDRRAALDIHLQEMGALIEEAEDGYDEIVAAMEQFDVEYEKVVTERNLKEEEFFAYSESFYGKNSYDSLEEFIDLAQRAARIKAYYNAYDLIKGMYVSSVDALRPRYKDIAANTEALIKGIHVFDIPASDIEAIIPVEEE